MLWEQQRSGSKGISSLEVQLSLLLSVSSVVQANIQNLRQRLSGVEGP